MKRFAYVSALIVFALYAVNVVFGTIGLGVFLSDVVEMVTLLVACILFVVALLFEEQASSDR